MWQRVGLFLIVMTWIAAGSTALEARPRDEVMSRVFRCAVIGDPRLWLDCYYGAAQPARVLG